MSSKGTREEDSSSVQNDVIELEAKLSIEDVVMCRDQTDLISQKSDERDSLDLNSDIRTKVQRWLDSLSSLAFLIYNIGTALEETDPEIELGTTATPKTTALSLVAGSTSAADCVQSSSRSTVRPQTREEDFVLASNTLIEQATEEMLLCGMGSQFMEEHGHLQVDETSSNLVIAES